MSNNKEKRKIRWIERAGRAERALPAVTPFLSSVSSFMSPFEPFVNYVKSLAGLVLIATVGSALAFFNGSLLIATLALLIEPMFALSLLSMLTRPLVMPFISAEMNTRNIILRPFYDYVALLTVGLPYALAWYWEGKVLGIGLLLLSDINVAYLGYAIAYLVLAFAVAGGMMTLIGRASTRGLGALGTVLKALSFTLSIYIGALVASLIFLWLFGYVPFPTIGDVAGFILSILTLREMTKLVPTRGWVPTTWSIIALIIGASALMGFYGIFIAVMVALVIYFAILYIISGDSMWLWYTVVAVPSAPVVAYYLGYVTKFLLDSGGLFVGEVIAASLETSLFIIYLAALILLIIILIALIIILFADILFSLLFFLFGIFILIGFIIALIIFVAFAIASISALVAMISLPSAISAAYNYLVYPA